MTAEDIINGDGELTPEALEQLNATELRKVASKLFEIKNVSKFTKDQLLYKMKEMLAEFQLEEDVKTVESFVRSEENQEKAVKMALNIRNGFDRNWFTADQLARAYNHAQKNAIQKIEDSEEYKEAMENFRNNPSTRETVISELETLNLFGLVKKKSDPRGKKPTKYKIVMTVVVRALERKKKEEVNDRAKEEVTEG